MIEPFPDLPSPRFSDDDWHMVGGEKDIIPIVIQCVVEDEEDHLGHSHMTFACIEKTRFVYLLDLPGKVK